MHSIHFSQHIAVTLKLYSFLQKIRVNGSHAVKTYTVGFDL